MQASRDIRMTPIRGRNLEGDDLVMPRDLEGDPAVLLVAFKMWQQADVDRWVFRLSPLADAGVSAYEVPVLSRAWSPVRRFIDGGMARSIDSRETRRHTITVYDDVRAVMRNWGITTTWRVTALAVSPGGAIVSRTDMGPDTDDGSRFLGALGAG